MTLQELLIGQFGVSQTDLRESFIAVGTSSTLILPNDPNRIGFIISNLSTNTCYVGMANAVTSTTGLILGGSNNLTSNWRDDFNTVGFQRYAISPSGTSNFYVAEIIMTGNEVKQSSGISSGS
jgi:hypothetical protein